MAWVTEYFSTAENAEVAEEKMFIIKNKNPLCVLRVLRGEKEIIRLATIYYTSFSDIQTHRAQFH
jgi:hypothetical protein